MLRDKVKKRVLRQVIFDKVELISTDERTYILGAYMGNHKSIDELSKELGIDRLIIRRFISDYQKRLRGA